MTATWARITATVRAFLHWWVAELIGMIPASLRRGWYSRERLVLAFDAASAVFALETPSGFAELGRLDDLSAPSRREIAQSILHGYAGKRRQLPLCLRLPFDSALHVTMGLPLAAKDNVAEVITFEMDRYTPFRAEQVSFAYRLPEHAPAGQRLLVDVTVVPRPTVEAALTAAADLGLQPDQIDVAGASPTDPPSDSLRVEDPAARVSEARHSAIHALAVLAAVLAMTAIAVPIVGAQRQASELTDSFASVKRRAQAIASLQQQVTALRADEDFLLQRKQRTATISKLLADVTRVLPDDVWLTEFSITGDNLQLGGYAHAASTLVGLLEHSQGFQHTSFLSPVTQDPLVGKERFSISAQVVEGGGP